MSVLFRQAARGAGTEQIPSRPFARPGSIAVTGKSAMFHSAVWAALRLRADLISTLPLDVFRKVGSIQVPVPSPPILLAPGGPNCRLMEWLYSSQIDLDKYGNCFGFVTMRDGQGLPARIELIPAGDVTVLLSKAGVVTYRIGTRVYDAAEIWHEKQYTVSGLPVGLSPIAHAAMSIGQYLSAQQFAVDWYGSGATPAAHLRNIKKVLAPGESQDVKEKFKTSISNGDLFVTGNDWEFNTVAAQQSDQRYIETMAASSTDIARFIGVPADLIDAFASGSAVTYANISQRNLQLLVMNLGPAIQRREEALSFGLLPQPRFIKLNTDALLRLDPLQRSAMTGQQLKDRMLAPSEARALDNREPLTPEQLEEIATLYGRPAGSVAPVPTTAQGVTQ